MLDALMDRVIPLPVDGSTVTDVVGTGGDGAHTVNISTMAALVTAAAGVRVVKHGGRSVSSKSGSADVIEALGIPLSLTPDQVARCVTEAGIGFTFAPNYHHGLRHAAPVRRALGVPTAINYLAPLTNPARPATALIGCSSLAIAPVLAAVLAGRGATALVVRGRDGLDEITTAAPTDVWAASGDGVRKESFDTARFGLAAPPARRPGRRGRRLQRQGRPRRRRRRARPRPRRRPGQRRRRARRPRRHQRTREPSRVPSRRPGPGTRRRQQWGRRAAARPVDRPRRRTRQSPLTGPAPSPGLPASQQRDLPRPLRHGRPPPRHVRGRDIAQQRGERLAPPLRHLHRHALARLARVGRADRRERPSSTADDDAGEPQAHAEATRAARSRHGRNTASSRTTSAGSSLVCTIVSSRFGLPATDRSESGARPAGSLPPLSRVRRCAGPPSG